MKTLTTVEVNCRMCKETKQLNVNMGDVQKWQEGALIQTVMPYLSAPERELLISGTCGECWKKLFGEEE